MSIDLSLLPDGGISWADASGPDGHIVLSTRIRLARNLQGMAFTTRARDDDRERIREQVVSASRESRSLPDAAVFPVEGLDRADRQLLYERHLISKELASAHSEETSDLMTDSLARTLSIGILPFLAVFAVIVGVRILEVL